jgi:hypothetical protein
LLFNKGSKSLRRIGEGNLSKSSHHFHDFHFVLQKNSNQTRLCLFLSGRKDNGFSLSQHKYPQTRAHNKTTANANECFKRHGVRRLNHQQRTGIEIEDAAAMQISLNMQILEPENETKQLRHELERVTNQRVFRETQTCAE